MASDFGEISLENSDVMKQGGFLDESQIRIQIGQSPGNFKRHLRNGLSVLDEKEIGL